MNIDETLEHLRADGFLGVRVADGSDLVFMSPTLPDHVVVDVSGDEREMSIDEFRSQYSGAKFRPARADESA